MSRYAAIFESGTVSTQSNRYSNNDGKALTDVYERTVIVNEMIELADGKSAIANALREGLVVRSKDGKTSFKAVSNKFLTKWSE